MEQELIKIISEQTGISNIDIHDDLIVMHGFDSIKFIQLVVLIEESFNLLIPDDMLIIQNFSSVSKIVNLIESISSYQSPV
ncbi:acyl carrier protein [Paenibacillus humicus]|uniref:acyl carrier protein n=1 Tax=Paenibacillus humicus TaxID=412861 RepID=UPI003D28EA39